MTMLKKTTYTIDGEELQKRISNEIESLKYNYREWRLAEPGSSDSENCYINYRANVAVLGELFRLQGLETMSKIWRNMTPSDTKSAILTEKSTTSAQRCMESSKHSKSKMTAKAKS